MISGGIFQSPSDLRIIIMQDDNSHRGEYPEQLYPGISFPSFRHFFFPFEYDPISVLFLLRKHGEEICLFPSDVIQSLCTLALKRA